MDDSESDSDESATHRKINKQNSEVDSISIADDSPSTSSAVNKTQKKKKPNDSAEDKTLSAITLFIVEDMQSTSIVKDAGFRKLITTLRPDLELPTQDDIMNNILLLYGIERANLLDTLASVESISLAIERWTSFSDNSYATIKANFFNDEWEPQSYVLSTVQLNDLNSFTLLNDKILEVIKNWEIQDKIVSTVYDWYPSPVSPPETKLYNELGTKIPCFALKLQKCIDNNFDSIPEIKVLIEKCKQLVAYFLHNNNAEIYLHKYQQLLEVSCDQLIQASDDEINSKYLMLERLLSQKSAIHSALCDTDATEPSTLAELELKEKEWLIIKELVATLKPFQLAKVVLYRVKDHIDSISVIKPIIYSFCTNFLVPSNETNAVGLLKQRIKEDFLTKFQLYVGDHKMNVPDYYDIATYLDPRYKNQEYMDKENQMTIQKYIHDVYFAKNENVDTKSKWSVSSKALSILFPSTSSQRKSSHECTRYHDESEIDKNLSPHKWWKLHERVYPMLSKVAKRHLCTHSTSKSIFTFRNASLRRKNLLPQIVDKLIFLNHKIKFDIF